MTAMRTTYVLEMAASPARTLQPRALISVVVILLAVADASAQGRQCPFNSMCNCKPHNSTLTAGIPADKSLEIIKDVTCVGVPFSRFPELPGGKLSHLDLVGSGLEMLETESLGGAQLSSLRLINNKISIVSDRAFAVTADTLKSLDLSYNELQEIPIEAVASVPNLYWLNLQSNHITSLAIKWRGLKDTLTDLFLGDNDIGYLPLAPDLSLSGFQRLKWLKLDNNDLSSLEPNSLPFSLKNLGLTHNILTVFPSEILANLKEIAWIYLRGNYIETLPTVKFSPRKTLEDLDLGDNGVTDIVNLFSGSITVKDLRLDSNDIKVIPMNVFKGLSCVRLNLSNNKIDTINDRAFLGLANTLEYLDLGNNELTSVTKGVRQLKKLKHLYLAGNDISVIPEDSFSNFSQSLRSLSLSGNKLRFVPTSSLHHLKKLTHLNLGYNRITGPLGNNYEEWGELLDTLLLMGNQITRIKAGSFSKLEKIKELSLSFNQIDKLDDRCFEPLSKHLESLEISFGLKGEEFPETALKPLTTLVWLALDYNEIKSLTRTTLYSFGNLQYLNLDGNNIAELPEYFFHSSIHKNLRDVRLSFNRLRALEPYSFSGLKELQSIVLTGNDITYIHENAFQNLPNTLTVVLSNNEISRVSTRAFVNVPNLVKLDLHNNNLKEFNLISFKNVTNPQVPMTLNLSNNHITDLIGGSSPFHVKHLDLSFNQLGSVPLQFLSAFNDSLRRLHLGYNKILMLVPWQFSRFTNLETLHLEHNGIVSLKHNSFQDLSNLQVLDLSYNHIEQIHMQQFQLKNLRILDLSFNHLRSIPRDAFQGTRLERLILANNEFVVIPAPPFMEVGYTLRLLDFSHNQIEHLDSIMFSEAPLLTELNLAHNKLTIIPDSFFRYVTNLIRLDLSGNKIHLTSADLFHYQKKLRYLSLAEAGLKTLPILPLPHLTHLNLSGNELMHLREPFLQTLHRLRVLDVSRNQISNLTGISWNLTTNLADLDISYNPLKILTKGNFAELENLQTLNVEGLPELVRFDSDALVKNKRLKWLKTQTWPKIEKYRFRLSRVMSSLTRLQKLSVMVTENKLLDQFGDSFPPKLRTLEITGKNLTELDKDCLEGLDSSKELTIRVHDTSIRNFPRGFFAKFAKAGSGLTLDLSNNLVESFGPELFYEDPSQWRRIGTKPISGGINVRDNPIVCNCQTEWLGEWMRRYLRESLQLHTAILETNQQVIATMKEAVCVHNTTGQRFPILTYSQTGCDYINTASSSTVSHHLMIVTLIILLFR